VRSADTFVSWIKGLHGSRSALCGSMIFCKLAAAVVLVLCACQARESSDGRSRTDADSPTRSSISESASASAPRPWYRRVRTLDLTGDGVADSVRLEATGSRPDSLGITLALIVNGHEKHLEAWSSSDELAELDSASRLPSRVATVLRARLDSVLASVIVQRLDAPGVRLMAEDSAVLSGLHPRPTQRISFSYGYETTVRLVWDAPRERFVRLWTCC